MKIIYSYWYTLLSRNLKKVLNNEQTSKPLRKCVWRRQQFSIVNQGRRKTTLKEALLFSNLFCILVFVSRCKLTVANVVFGKWIAEFEICYIQQILSTKFAFAGIKDWKTAFFDAAFWSGMRTDQWYYSDL